MKFFTSLSLLTLLALLALASCTANKKATPAAELLEEPTVCDFVNPFVGTGGHGHTYPGATMPFGMVQLSPDTRLTGWDGCGGYHDSDSLIYGFSHTHLQGTGISDYGDILLSPTNSAVHQGKNWGERYRSAFRKETEKASPGYYSVFLDDQNIETELTTTTRVGIHKYHLTNQADSFTVFIDLAHRDPLIEYQFYPLNDSTVAGMRVSKEWAEEQHVYFVAEFSRPFIYTDQTFEIVYEELDNGEIRNYQEMVPVFPLVFNQGADLMVKVALSPVDIEGALQNLKTEAPHWDFGRYKTAAKKAWLEELSKIDIATQDTAILQNFYTALYHSYTVPNTFTDVDGRYRGVDMETHSATDHEQYTVFSLWDTFRASHPLYTITQRDKTKDFIHSFLKMYDQGGDLPMWELAGNYTHCMIGYNAVPVIVDAYIKGITDFDTQKALEAMVKTSEAVEFGKEHFREKGYISMEDEGESVSKNLEYAYNDWCIAIFAEALGNMEVAETYYRSAQNYRNTIDGEIGYCRAKRNGDWISPFDPSEVNFNFTEANSYQYSFFVPQDVDGLITHVGGEKRFNELLDKLFTAPMDLAGRHQPDITGLIGQYAHGNEPSHHMAYLYNYSGQPWKTQYRTQEILRDLYSPTPDGLSGNEDCGQMSSWYVLSAMGIYSVTPGSREYALSAPIIDSAAIHLENGNTFSISTSMLEMELEEIAPKEKRRYISSVRYNGADWPNSSCLAISSGVVASDVFNNRAASGKFGVRRLACGRIREISAITAASCKSASPDFAIITGSTTIGPSNADKRSASVSMIGTENNIPNLTTLTLRSDKTASICAATTSAGTSCTAVTPLVFWAVTAVMTLALYARAAEIALMSACTPAPPPLSEPAMVRTIGVCCVMGTSPQYGACQRENEPSAIIVAQFTRFLRRYNPDQVRRVGARTSQPNRPPDGLICYRFGRIFRAKQCNSSA